MNELKTFVESVVRPIRAEESLKLRMRNELFAHLSDAYALELAAEANPARAVQHTLARIGSADELRRDLQASVPLVSRGAGAIDHLMRRRKGVSAIAHAARLAAAFGGAVTVMILLVMTLRLNEILQWTPESTVMLRVGLGTALLFTFNVFVFALLSGTIRDMVARRFSGRYDWLLALFLFVAGTASMLFGGWMFVFLASGDAVAALTDLWRWGALAALFLPSAFVVTWLDIAERRGLDDWLALDLNGTPPQQTA